MKLGTFGLVVGLILFTSLIFLSNLLNEVTFNWPAAVREDASSYSTQLVKLRTFKSGLNLKIVKEPAVGGIFDFILQGVYDGFQGKGVPVDFVDSFNLTDEESIYITATAFLLNAKPKYYIAYNWEQFTTDKEWTDQEFEQLRNAQEVWDFSPLNVALLKTKGIEAKVILPGYHNKMGAGLLELETFHRPYEIFFAGALNDDRLDFIDKLTERYGDKFHFNDNLFGQNLQKELVKSKVSLNMHYYGGSPLLEIHRIMEAVAHKNLVLSVHSSDKWLDDYFSPLVYYFDDFDSLISQFEVIRNFTSTEWGLEVSSRLLHFQSMPKFIDNLQAVDSILFV